MLRDSHALALGLRSIARGLELLAAAIEQAESTPATTNETRALSVAEVAERLGISERSVRRLIDRGELRARRLGARVLIAEADLQQLLSQPPAPGARAE